MNERFYVDCEFDGHGGPLLSIALVHEGGCSIHVQTIERPRDPWVQENVMPIMDAHNAATESVDVPLNGVGRILRDWLGEAQNPVFVADSPVDIGRICEVLSTGEDGGWQSCGYPRMSFEVHNVDCYPTDLPGAVQHNAWWDAMALRHRLASVDRNPEGEKPQALSAKHESAVGEAETPNQEESRMTQFPAGTGARPTSSARVIDPLHMTHRVAFRPRYESRPRWQSPGRREFVHGPIVPMASEGGNALWWWFAAAVCAPFVASWIGGMA